MYGRAATTALGHLARSRLALSTWSIAVQHAPALLGKPHAAQVTPPREERPFILVELQSGRQRQVDVPRPGERGAGHRVRKNGDAAQLQRFAD